MPSFHIIPHIRPRGRYQQNHFFLGKGSSAGYFYYLIKVWHGRCNSILQEIFEMNILTSPLFWDKKIRIMVLTLATFAALC